MKKIEVLNFHNLHIENAKVINKPLNQTKFEEKDGLVVVFVRDPYDYFDYLLYDYLAHQRSLLFTQDIIDHMKTQKGETFLKWLDTINFIPFYNPQTFQLDISKRESVAIENLESFDYVVPYEEIDIFLEHVAPDITIEKEEVKKMLFSLGSQREDELTEKFVGKDMKLYQKSLELWKLSKKNGFKPLGSLIEQKVSLNDIRNRKKKPDEMQKYKGIAGKISENSIVGWVFHKEKQEIALIEIYCNGKLLSKVKADKKREDLKKQNIHPTGKCGFEMVFDMPTFKRGDRVEIKILPERTLLPLGKNVKEFLGL